MANTKYNGFGLRAVMTVGNTPATSGQSEYKIKQSRCWILPKGNPGSLQDAGRSQVSYKMQALQQLMMAETAERFCW